MTRNPYGIGLLAVGVLALIGAGVFGLGLSETLDVLTPDGGQVVGYLVAVVVSLGVGVLSLLVAALLAGIGWEFRQDRATWAEEPGEPRVLTTPDESLDAGTAV